MKKSYKITIVKPPKSPKHLSSIAIGLAVSLIVLTAIKEGRKPSKEDMKKLSSVLIKGALL